MFGRLEAALNSEIKTLGHPRAALLGFAAAVLAYNVLALLARLTEEAHRAQHPELDVSAYHLALEIGYDYGTMLQLLPPEHWPQPEADGAQLVRRLLRLAARLNPKQLATAKHKTAKSSRARGYVAGPIARSHVSTARVLKRAAGQRP